MTETPAPAQPLFGPVIYAEAGSETQLKYGIVCGAVACPSFSCVDAAAVSTPREISSFGDMRFYRWDISIDAATHIRQINYTVNGAVFSFYTPGAQAGINEFRIGYVSCNGSEKDSPQAMPAPDKYALWGDLVYEHDRSPFLILLHGGDQIYADRVWHEVPALAAWMKNGQKIKHAPAVTDALRAEIRSYYYRLYMQVWSQPDIRTMLASVPSLMIWDDHDIFDGWGSWSSRRQTSPVYQAIFDAALDAFCLFQRGQSAADAGIVPNDFHLGKAVRYADCAIIVPDLRSQRTREQVMGKSGIDWFEKQLAAAAQPRDTVVVFSVPLATGHFSALDGILTNFPDWLARILPEKLNPKRFADDIHDQWRVPAHRDEWRSMISRLLDHRRKTNSRVTLISGEIHMGARSTIAEKGHGKITQYIASGIAHPPMNLAVVFFCEWLSRGLQDLSDTLSIRMERIYPTSRRRYIASRNWFSLVFTRRGDSLGTWHTEGNAGVTHDRKNKSL